MRQSQAETRRQNVAKRSMTKEAKQLAGLIAGLRESLEGIHKERTSAKLTGAEMGMPACSAAFGSFQPKSSSTSLVKLRITVTVLPLRLMVTARRSWTLIESSFAVR